MDEALVARVDLLDAAVGNMQQAVLALVSSVYWMYNHADVMTREEAMDQIRTFNETYHLVEDLDVIDPEDFDNLSPEDFGA